MSNLKPGRIVLIEVADPQGRNPMRRPVVVIECSADPVTAVAISGQSGQDPDYEVDLPWHRDGKVLTRLTKPSVAVCSWLVQFKEADVVAYGGVVPPEKFKEIQTLIASRNP